MRRRHLKLVRPQESATRHENPEHPEIEQRNSADHFGGCPECGRNDGFVNIGRQHWFYCAMHLTTWLAGENLFGCWRTEDEVTWQANKDFLRDFLVVAPLYRD